MTSAGPYTAIISGILIKLEFFNILNDPMLGITSHHRTDLCWAPFEQEMRNIAAGDKAI